MTYWPRWRPMDGAVLLVSWLLLSTQSGCGADITEACAEDTQIPCTCDDGSDGTLACSDGRLGACECRDLPKGVCRSDAQCDDGAFCNGRESCEPENKKADKHGCVISSETPFCDDGIDCTVDSCSSALNRCVFVAPDEDGDGFGDTECEDADGNPLGEDCDDDDAQRFPGNFEVCDEDNVDEDCDETTFGLRDQDGDGAIDEECCNGKNCGDDCNDKNIAQRPLQPEFCDDIDNDCDGDVDEEAGDVPWYVDDDGDGFGTDAHDALESCIPIQGRSLLQTDCNDSLTARHPAQYEACDLADNNCNGLADEGPECGVPLGYPVIPGGGGVTPSTGGSTTGDGSGGSAGGDGGNGGSGGLDNSGGAGGTSGTGGSGGSGGSGTGGALPDELECDDRDLSDAVQWGGAIAGATTWSGVIHLTEDLALGSGDVLTLEAGTLVVADEGVRITASSGRFDIQGTEDEPVKFCGKEGVAGYWDGIALSDADPESSWTWVLISDGGGGGIPGALVASAPIPMEHILVRNSGDVGISADEWGFGSAHVSVTESVGTGLVLNQIAALAALPLGGTFDGNGDDVARIVFASWNEPVTLHDIGIPYLVKQNMLQNGSGDLTIEAGVEILMEAATTLEFGWNSSVVRINLAGTADDPIVFSGREAGNGFWGGLVFHQNLEVGSQISHVVIRDGGSGGPAMSLRGAVPLDGLTLEDNGGPALEVLSAGFSAGSKGVSIAGTSGAPLYLHGNALASLPSDTQFADNEGEYIEIEPGTSISTSGSIPALELPYYLPSSVSLRGANVLTVEAGVHMLFGTDGFFEVGWNSNSSTLHVAGTASQPVVFDHLLGESGGWEGLILNVNVTTDSTLEHLEIRNAGGNATGALNVKMNPALPEDHLTDCSFIDSESWGVYVSSSDKSQDYSGNTFSGNALGAVGP